MGMPVEPPAVRMDGAENTDIQRPFAGGVQQVIHRQAAEVVKELAVNYKQGPERIGESEDKVNPVTVRQTVKLGGNPQVGGLFPTGRTGAAVAGVGNVSDMPATGIIAAKLLHAGDAGSAGEHLCDGFDFYIAQAAGVEKGCPALVGRKEFFRGQC
ncbi:hypothetical protein SODG_002834 [Sodalis praecaptivus]